MPLEAEGRPDSTIAMAKHCRFGQNSTLAQLQHIALASFSDKAKAITQHAV
jgi:hypothetical protein